MSLRTAIAHVLLAGAENTEVSNQSSPEPIPPSTFGVPVAFGVFVLPGARSPAAFAVKSIGVPEMADTTPVTCQSPTTLPRAPSRIHLPSGPHGSM